MALTQDKNGPRSPSAAWRKWAWRIAVALLALFVIIPPAVVRIRCFLMTQRIQAVLHGLQQIRIDETTEAELLKIAPELTAFDYGHGPPEFASEHHYHFDISNKEDWWYVMTWPTASFLYEPGRFETGDRPIPTAIGDWLGFRFLGFNASVIVLNGKVSSIYYDLAWDLQYHGRGDVLAVRSYHGLWEERHRPRRTSDLSDQAPQYLARGSERGIGVWYTFDAAGNLVNHAFQVDLSCFWSLRGCRSVRQMAPLLWADKENIESATALRLNSDDPCPDRLLADRVRYMLDVNVELLEVVGSRLEKSGNKRVIDYRPKEVVLGEARGPWVGLPYPQLAVQVPGGTSSIARDFPRLLKPGDLVLAFTGVYGGNCMIVPATASAVSTIRHVVRAPRRRDDTYFDFHFGFR